MARLIHVYLDVRGALLNYTDEDFVGFRDESGCQMSPYEARSALLDALLSGVAALPIGEPCEGFDYKTGCPGHDAKELAGPAARGTRGEALSRG